MAPTYCLQKPLLTETYQDFRLDDRRNESK